ncbi:MAG: hypothetical protein WCV59_05475 [Parcubacteria group bacterium]|jgi:hypothetical protein
MILLAICTIIGGYIFWKKVCKDEDIKFLKPLLVVLGCLIGAFGGMLLSAFFSVIVPQTTYDIEFDRVELVALGSTSEMQGNFFLASGSIGSHQFYKFYYKTPDGGKQFGKLPAESAVIYEEDRKDAYMAKAGKEKHYPTWVYWWVRIFPGGTSWEYAIHVPNGTIKVEYNLDLK